MVVAALAAWLCGECFWALFTFKVCRHLRNMALLCKLFPSKLEEKLFVLLFYAFQPLWAKHAPGRVLKSCW